MPQIIAFFHTIAAAQSVVEESNDLGHGCWPVPVPGTIEFYAHDVDELQYSNYNK